MEISVNVWRASEVPDQIWSLDLPNIPYPVATNVEVSAVAGDEKGGQDVFFLDGSHGRIDVVRTKTGEHVSHGFQEGELLVSCKTGDGQTGYV